MLKNIRWTESRAAATSAGEREQRGRNVVVGQVVVGAADGFGQPSLGGHRGTVGDGRAARRGGVHGQQVPAGPGADSCRPADQRLVLRAAAERDHDALPDVTAAKMLAAGPAQQGAARQRGGHPPEGKLAQRRQVSRLERPVQRAPGPLGRVDVAAGHPVPQRLRRHVHQLDLIRGGNDRIRHRFPGGTPVILFTTSASDSRFWMLAVETTSIPARSRSSTSCQRAA